VLVLQQFQCEHLVVEFRQHVGSNLDEGV